MSDIAPAFDPRLKEFVTVHGTALPPRSWFIRIDGMQFPLKIAGGRQT
jgi:hypothetical protein